MVRNLLSLILLLSVSLASATDVFKISPLAVRTPGLSGIELLHSDGQFTILKDGQLVSVNPHDVDEEIRELSSQELQLVSGMGKFLVKQFDNGEYSVKLAGGLKGGGPIVATAFYWTTKSLCWLGVGTGAAVVATGITAATVATGGAAGGAIGAGAAAAVGTGVPAAATVGGAAIASVVPTATAVAATQTAVAVSAGVGVGATAGAIAGTAAAIEGVSVGAFICGMALGPF